VTERYLVAPSY